MPATASDMLALGNAMGPGGYERAQRLFGYLTDSSNADGSTALSAAYASVSEAGGPGPYKKTILTFTSLPISMTDEAGVVAYGGSKVYDFPEGNILIHGATANLTLLKSGAGINADFDGDFGVGTVTATNDAALATTEQNIIPTTATPQAVAGATTAKGINAADIAPLDGTTTPVDVFLNFVIDDLDQNGGGTLLVSGTLTLLWTSLGDR